MKFILIIAVSLLPFIETIACSCAPSYSFCSTFSQYNFAASFKIIEKFPHGISLKVLHRLHGTEIKDTINVWDRGGPYSSCNDSIGEANASTLGLLGDTIILAISKIEILTNPWDVVGEYQKPNYFNNCSSYMLRVQNQMVSGLIIGINWGIFSGIPCFCRTEYIYQDFLDDFPEKSQDCNLWLSADETVTESIFSYSPNPASSYIQLETPPKGKVIISNFLGQMVDGLNIVQNSTQFSTSHLAAGIYMVTYIDDGVRKSKKLIIHKE